MAKAKVEKLLLYTETVPLDKGRAEEPKDIREKLATALRPSLGAYTLAEEGKVELRVSRTTGSPHVYLKAHHVGGHRYSRSSDFAIVVSTASWRDKEDRRYPVASHTDRSTPGHWVFSYSVNLTGVLAALDAALDRAEKKAAYEAEQARDRRTAYDAETARRDRVAALFNRDPDTVSLDASASTAHGRVYRITLAKLTLTGRAVAPLLGLFPDAEVEIKYRELKLSGIPEAELDAVLDREVVTVRLAGNFSDEQA
ncbi:MAG TPA: hypothetical protein VFP27_16410 [Mycobacterium sp.]|nr:hypothetical protein [Mycobacterium sp.]